MTVPPVAREEFRRCGRCGRPAPSVKPTSRRSTPSDSKPGTNRRMLAGMLVRSEIEADPREENRWRHRGEPSARLSVSSSRTTRARLAPRRKPDGGLAVALGRSRHKQVGDVRAGDQQHHQRRRLPQGHHGASTEVHIPSARV